MNEKLKPKMNKVLSNGKVKLKKKTTESIPSKSGEATPLNPNKV